MNLLHSLDIYYTTLNVKRQVNLSTDYIDFLTTDYTDLTDLRREMLDS